MSYLGRPARRLKGLSEERSKPIALQESAEGIVVDETSRGPVMARLNRDTRRLTSTKARTVYRGLGC